MKIINTQIFGLSESIVRSGHPMRTEIPYLPRDCYRPTEDDISRANKLGAAPIGSGHDKFLRGIIVQADIIAPRYFWQEWDTYHFNESISSQSTMHRAGKFTLDEMANKYVDKEMLDMLKYHIQMYNLNPTEEHLLKVKSNWLEGIELGRGISTNYQSCKTMYSQRRLHRLPEWREILCPWIKSLPMAKDLGVIS